MAEFGTADELRMLVNALGFAQIGDGVFLRVERVIGPDQIEFRVGEETDRFPVAPFLEYLLELGLDDTAIMAAAVELGLLDD